jgi:hypothetical protein
MSPTCGENPADGEWRAWRGSERRMSKSWTADEVRNGGQVLDEQEWFGEAYQGTPSKNLWGTLGRALDRGPDNDPTGPCES